METDTDVLYMMAKFIVNASVKAEIIELLHHQSGVYASCRKFQGSNSTVSTFAFWNTLYHWMHLSTIDIGDISNHDKRPLSSQTSLVYLPLRAAAMLEDAWTRVLSFADGAAEVLQIQVQILYYCLIYMTRGASRFMQWRVTHTWYLN